MRCKAPAGWTRRCHSAGGKRTATAFGGAFCVGLRWRVLLVSPWWLLRGLPWCVRGPRVAPPVVSRGAGGPGALCGAGFTPACAGSRKPGKHGAGTPLQSVKRGKKTSGHGSSDRPDPAAHPETSTLHEPGRKSRAHERSPMSQVPPHIPPAPGLSESRASAPLPPGAGARLLFVLDVTGRRGRRRRRRLGEGEGWGGERPGRTMVRIRWQLRAHTAVARRRSGREHVEKAGHPVPEPRGGPPEWQIVPHGHSLPE